MIQKYLVKIIRLILVPFSLLYSLVLSTRNYFFDSGVFKHTSFDIPVIAVGNISVGGTGKTPQIEYFIRLLQDEFSIAVLSRGYKRKSKGFVQASKDTKVEELGDEPFQFFKKFRNITVAVDADRTNGIKQILKRNPSVDLILLDDAYQHRKVKASFYTLLTAYNNRYTKDFVLPLGNLRESRNGAKRANAIIITKCPSDLSVSEKENIIREIKPKKNQTVLFSSIQYNEHINSNKNEIKLTEIKSHSVILVTGIAKPHTLLEYLTSNEIHYVHFNFPDHHNFTVTDIDRIRASYEDVDDSEKLILTTEKDYTKLNGRLDNLYSLGIRTKFLYDFDKFDSQIKNHLIEFKN